MIGLFIYYVYLSCLLFLYCCHLANKVVYYVETAKDTAIVAKECEEETVPKLSNSTIFNSVA